MKKLPKKKDYERFLRDFSKGLSKDFPGVCFYTYGSVDNEDCNYGLSDIDGGIILNSGVITKKEQVFSISELLSECLGNDLIDTDFNLLDRKTSSDGRFMSYTKDYTDWLKYNAKIRSGPNYIHEMNGRDFKSGTLHAASFNFSGPGGVRNSILYSIHRYKNKNDFARSIFKAIDKVIKFPKKLIYLREDELIPSKIEAKNRLEDMLPNLDLTIIEKINSSIKTNPKKFYSKLENVNSSFKLLEDSLNCIESMVDSYIRQYPEINERELKV